MAYRLVSASSDNVEFGIAPFSGAVLGAVTVAAFVKRAALARTDALAGIQSSGLSTRVLLRASTADAVQFTRSGTSTSSQLISDTTKWYLIVATCAAGAATPRFHVHDGTSWVHAAAASGSSSGDYTVVGTDRLFFGLPFTSTWGGDVVCAGIKKADSSDATVETLSRTAFSAWTAFGFDWLIGFDASLESAGILQDQASPGTGDEIAISGTSAVSDPPGWAWGGAPAAPTFVPQLVIL